MRIHFIAIGGAVMHNLAIALHKKGYKVTGSDDEIFEPSRTRLASYGLLPQKVGWNAGIITRDIHTIILGMHAKADNPEMIRAQELGIRIMSFPEYLYEETKDKKRIVIGGSHGKTTTTALIMHVMRHSGISFDYMAGSSLEGYETMVGLLNDTKLAIFEGDEYLTSTIDRRPKFHLYKPDIAIITGIAWDHMNVFPTYENYIEQFKIYIDTITPGGTLIYFEGDGEVKKIAETARSDIKKIPYKTHEYSQDKTGFYATSYNRHVPLNIFGKHNMQNISAAREACLSTGISEDQFYSAIPSFKGTSKRLQKVKETENGIVFIDFAHAPSKVKATVDAVAERYDNHQIIACLELHTFSSLNSEFLPQYRGTLDNTSSAFVYFNPHALELKKLSPLSKEKVKEAFGNDKIKVFNNSSDLFSEIRSLKFNNPVYLIMSSGDFDGCDINMLADKLLYNKKDLF
jgi:UDP-N-acetylmuramate: L-alanyl-gamma-D-glutamyl-meso-diaminopimelate ligase